MNARLKPRKVVVLGSTGSIGKSTLRVARALPEEIEIIGLAAATNHEELAAQAHASGARNVAIFDASRAPALRALVADGVTVHAGAAGLVELAAATDADVVVVAIVGTAGLEPALAAIAAGRDLAVASKEILVMAGETVTSAAALHGTRLLPVDSEHNAIHQCLAGRNAAPEEVARLVLTASGGPFRKTAAAELEHVTPEQALRHPTWEMGPKITIDSATLFNKGLEMIEARWLFGIGMNHIDVVVHPQSIIHSMVEFIDGSVLAQMSHTDMAFPIQYALTWPRRLRGDMPRLDFPALGALTFEAPRDEVFPALRLARHAGTTGGTLPAVFNAANEIAVEAFRNGILRFPGIWQTVETVMEAHHCTARPTLEEIIAADADARAHARRIAGIG